MSNVHREHLQIKPSKLLDKLDDKGHPTQWECSNELWNKLFIEARQLSVDIIQKSMSTCPEMTAQANCLDIAHTATVRAIEYTQWSIATERACIISNGDEDQIAQSNADKCNMLGRGRPPVYRMR